MKTYSCYTDVPLLSQRAALPLDARHKLHLISSVVFSYQSTKYENIYP